MGRAGACVPREVLVEARVGHGRRRAESERKWFLLKTLTVKLPPVGQPEAAGG